MQQLRAPYGVPASTKRAHLMREIVETVLFVALVFVIVQFVIKPYRVNSNSMSPALQQDELVVVNRAAYLLAGPSRGDVVVFYNPVNLSQQLIGRVVAIPGDTITITPTQVIVDGVVLKEPYVTVPFGVAANPVVVAPLKLGSDQYYIMVDNRLQGGNSDSRSFGPVSGRNVVGQAEVVFWPLGHVRGVDAHSNVFNGVGQ